MTSARTSTRHIGLLLFDDVEELDAVGPWEVLSYWTLHHPEDGWSISCVSRDGAPVVAAKGLTLSAHHSMSGMPPLDVLIHPGGQGTRPLMRNPQHLAWVRVQRRHRPADDERVHRSARVRGRGPARAAGPRPRTGSPSTCSTSSTRRIDVNPEARYVDDGNVITSAGVSAGIDMALHLVARLAGVDRAREVRRAIQYDPQPPI